MTSPPGSELPLMTDFQHPRDQQQQQQPAAGATTTDLSESCAACSDECSSYSWGQILSRAFIVILAWSLMSMMLFGMNFMLDSFPDSRAASYSTLLVCAISFAVLALLFFIVCYCCAHYCDAYASARPAFRGLLEPDHLKELFALGFVDAMGGFTGTYGAPNTPIAIQFTIMATGVVWTFVLARWLVPDRGRPCTAFVFVAVLLTVVGAGVTIAPQWSSMEKLRGAASSVGWILIFVLASLFPLLENVLYSRYLVRHVDWEGRSIMPDSNDNKQNNTLGENNAGDAIYNDAENGNLNDNNDSSGNSSNWPYFAARLSVALLGDALCQLVVVLLLFPLDFSPWFGASHDFDQTTLWLEHGFADVLRGRSNPHTFAYFIVYSVGFTASHMMGAALSYYSPQLTAFIYSVNTPMNLILLVVIPSWNVFGLVAPAAYSVASIALTAIGAIMYAAWEQNQRRLVAAAAAAAAAAGAVDQENEA